MRTGSKTFSHG